MSWSVNPTLEELDGKHVLTATGNGTFVEGRMNKVGQIENGDNPIQLYTKQDGKIVLNHEFSWVRTVWDERDWSPIPVGLACVGDAFVFYNNLFVVQTVLDEPQRPISFIVRDPMDTRNYTVSAHMPSLALRMILPERQGVYKTDNGTVVIRTKDHWELFDKKFNGSVELDDDELRAYLCNKGALNHAAVSKLEKEGQA